MRKVLRLLIQTFLVVSLCYAGYLLVLLSIPYTDFEPDTDFLLTKQLIYHLRHWRLGFYVHVFSSVTLVFVGLIQFSPFILKRLPKWHRYSGYVYVLTVLFLSGPSALVLALYANGGLPAQTSFVCLTMSWLFCTALAWKTIRKRQFEAHGNWMLRSYALTLSAVTLRLYAFLFDVFHVPIPPVETYILLAWISWIPNLLLAEVLIRKGFIRRLLKGTLPVG